MSFWGSSKKNYPSVHSRSKLTGSSIYRKQESSGLPQTPAPQTPFSAPQRLQFRFAPEGSWSPGLGAEPSTGPGSVRHLDMMTKAPSNISSGLTASACVSLSPEFSRSPLAKLHTDPRPWNRNATALRKKKRECLLTLSPPCSCHQIAVCPLGPRVDQQHVPLSWTRANIVLWGTREVFIWQPAWSRHSSLGLGAYPEQRTWERTLGQAEALWPWCTREPGEHRAFLRESLSPSENRYQ